MTISAHRGKFDVTVTLFIKTVGTFERAVQVEQAAKALLAQTKREIRAAYGDARGGPRKGSWQKGQQCVRSPANIKGARMLLLKKRAAKKRRAVPKTIEYV